MHNLKDLRKNLEIFEKKFKDRNLNFDIKDFNEKDKLNRELISKKELLEQEKKILSKSKERKNFEKSKEISKKIELISVDQKKAQDSVNKIVFNLPNIARDDVPIAKDEKGNKLIKKIGNIKKFDYQIKSHIDLGLKNKSIDFDLLRKGFGI